MENILTIDLFGQQFKVSSETDVKTAKAVAETFETEVRRVERDLTNERPNISKEIVLIIAALNITKQYVEFQAHHASMIDAIKKHSDTLNTKLQNVILV